MTRYSNISEKELVEKVLKRLDRDWHINQEVYGKNQFGEKYRIDAIIKPKDVTEWKKKDVSFGLEFKKIPLHTKELNEMFYQCYVYQRVDWKDHGRIPILYCPPVRNNPRAKESILHLASRWGIGELVNLPHYKLSVVFNYTHRAWSELHGVEHLGKTSDFKDYVKLEK